MGLTSSKKIETNKYELLVTVGVEEFTPAVDRAFRKKAPNISIPGFRKGKAPKAMVYKMFGEGMFYEDAVNELYPDAYSKAVEEADIVPVAYPDIEVTRVDKEGFDFKAEVVTKPEVEVSDYTGIKATKAVKTVSDSEIDEELDRMRHRNARTLSVSDRAAKDGDTAVINYEGFVDGEAFEGGKDEGHHLKLGSGQFIPGFEEQIVGHSADEEFDVTVNFPEDYHAEQLKGKAAVFKVKLCEIEEEQLPELDDEFVKDVSEFDSLDELKKSIAERLQKAKDDQANSEFENMLIDGVIANMKAEIPVEMTEGKIDDMIRDYQYRLQSQGISMEMYMQYMGQTPEAFRDTFRESAEKQVKIRLALEKVAEIEQIECTDEDVEKEYARMAEQYNNTVEKLRTMVPEKSLREDIKVSKAIDLVRDSAVVTEEGEAPDSAEEKPKPKRTRKPKKAADEE